MNEFYANLPYPAYTRLTMMMAYHDQWAFVKLAELIIEMGDNSLEAVFNEVKRLMEIRAMTIFVKYVHQVNGENLFLDEYKAEVQDKFDEIKLEAITNLIE